MTTQGASAGLSFKARRQFTLNGHTYERGDEVPLAVIPPNKFEVWRSSRLIVPNVDRPRSVAAQSALAMQEAGDRTTAMIHGEAAAAANGGAKWMPPGGEKAEKAAEPGRDGIPGGEAIQGEPGSYIQHVGRGWFVVYHEGAEPVKVRGAGPASDKLRELRGEAGEGKGVTILGGGGGDESSGAPGETPTGGGLALTDESAHAAAIMEAE
jgi:hypothetical protein